MRRVDADDRDARAADASPGHRELERKGARAADDVPVLVCRMRALDGEVPGKPLGVLGAGLHAEVVADREQACSNSSASFVGRTSTIRTPPGRTAAAACGRARSRGRARPATAHARGRHARGRGTRTRRGTRCEIGDVELEVRCVVGPPRVGAGPIPPGVPRADVVRDLEDDRLAVAVRARAQRRLDVDESEPQRVEARQLERARVAHHQEERGGRDRLRERRRSSSGRCRKR
jgi:hypothetical protein